MSDGVRSLYSNAKEEGSPSIKENLSIPAIPIPIILKYPRKQGKNEMAGMGMVGMRNLIFK